MKIAITADIHLTSVKDNPERFHALESILNRLVEDRIPVLIIAGDLFDATAQEYHDFEKIIGKKKYQGLKIISIRGNHDHTSKTRFL